MTIIILGYYFPLYRDNIENADFRMTFKELKKDCEENPKRYSYLGEGLIEYHDPRIYAVYTIGAKNFIEFLKFKFFFFCLNNKRKEKAEEKIYKEYMESLRSNVY